MHPVPLIAAIALLILMVGRGRGHRWTWFAIRGFAIAVLLGFAFGLIPVPDMEKLVSETAQKLGPWTYLFVGVAAFLETGAFVGLVMPGETIVLFGGVAAGEGVIELIPLIGLVWFCAVAGDVSSYFLGRKLGRGFLLEHGHRLLITPERLETVEKYFARYGGSTVLVGRFIGLVRALAPFIAGASRMPLRRFLPFDVLGAGLWAASICLLGYIFWQSVSQATEYLGRGLLAFAGFIFTVIVVLQVRRLRREPQRREELRLWLARNTEREGVRPLVRFVVWLWHKLGEPVWRRVVLPVARPIAELGRIFFDRLTPGDLGLEVTTLLALAAVGLFAFGALADLISEIPLPHVDRWAFSVVSNIYSPTGEQVTKVISWFGSLPAIAVISVATAIWALTRKLTYEALTLLVGLILTVTAVNVAKVAVDRPRPTGSYVETMGASFPSGHSAYAIALIACAVVIARSGFKLSGHIGLITIATILAGLIASSRVYLRAHYLTDTLGGMGLSLGIFALCGTVAIVISFIRKNMKSQQ